jgi:DNA-binding transcriptional MerR regulator
MEILAMDRAADAFRTISEVAEDLDLPQHVLRFWETRFTQIKPMKRGGGRRYYRPDDVELLRAIRHLLYGEGYTIRGVQRILKEQGAKAVIALVREGATRPALAQAQPQPQAPSSARIEPMMSGQALPDDEDDEDLAPVGYSDQAGGHEFVGGLSSADISALQGGLVDLAECERLLAAART